MNLCYLLPPIFGFLIGALTVLLLGYFVKKYFKFDESELTEDLKSLIDKHLDDLVGAFARQIPMSSLFLTGSLAGKLKQQASEEILKMAPSLKEKLFERLKHKIKANRYLLKASGLGSFIGLILGLIQTLIFFFCG